MAEDGIFFLAWLLNLKMVEVFACSDTTVPLAGPGSQWNARDGCASLGGARRRAVLVIGTAAWQDHSDHSYSVKIVKGCMTSLAAAVYCQEMSTIVYMVGRSWKHFDQLNKGVGRMQKFVPSWSRFTGRCTNLWRPSLSCGPWCPMVSHGAFDYGGASMAEKQSSRKAALRKKVPWPIRGTPRGTPDSPGWSNKHRQQETTDLRGHGAMPWGLDMSCTRNCYIDPR